MGRWDWLGLSERRWAKAPDEEFRPAKTAWDWLQLAVVPAMLAVIALAFNAAESGRDRSGEDRRLAHDQLLAAAARRDATLDAYFARMSQLVLDRGLLRSEPGSAVRHVARALTLTALRRLDGERKGELARYLIEGGLVRCGRDCLKVSTPVPVVDLNGADLRKADLRQADLLDFDLSGANLEGALFDRAALAHGLLRRANLRRASFRGAVVSETVFDTADLSHASFAGAQIGEPDRAGPSSRPLGRREATTFILTCLNSTSFAGAAFNGPVSFDAAVAHGLNFTRARGLARIDATRAMLVGVRLQGAHGKPRGWDPSAPTGLLADSSCHVFP